MGIRPGKGVCANRRPIEGRTHRISIAAFLLTVVLGDPQATIRAMCYQSRRHRAPAAFPAHRLRPIVHGIRDMTSYSIHIRWAALVCVLAIHAATAGAQAAPPAARPEPDSLTAAQWRADLAYLAATLPAKHPKPFAKIARERWLAAVHDLDDRIPSLARDEILVGFARLVAMIGDAHTIAYAANVPPGFHSLPIRLYWFADGIHVIATARGRESLLGLRLERVGSTSVDSAVAAVTRTFVDENEALRKTGAVQALTTVEVLHAQHLIEDPSSATLAFTRPGPPETADTSVTLAPLTAAEPIVRWPDFAGSSTPLARSRPQSWYWSQRDSASGVHFIQYNRCQDSPELKVSDFVARALAEIDASPPRAVVVDLRYNGGGSSSLLKPLIHGLADRKALNAPDRLFVLVGRLTFSSALMNAIQFRQSTRATLVGEPTGGKPNHFGETQTFTLPNSRMVIQHSTKFFREQEKDEDALYPDVRIDVASADYAAGRDPAMEEVLRRVGGSR